MKNYDVSSDLYFTLYFRYRRRYSSRQVIIQKPLECIHCDASPLSCLCYRYRFTWWAATVASGTCTTGTGGDTTGTSHAIKCKGAAAIGARVRPTGGPDVWPSACHKLVLSLPPCPLLAVSPSPIELPAYGICTGREWDSMPIAMWPCVLLLSQ